MASAAGGACGVILAQGAIVLADRVRGALTRSASDLVNWCVGRSYNNVQRRQFKEYRRLCASHCAPTAHLDFFDFNEVDQCPTKCKDDIIVRHVSLENADAPYNLCKERRALVRVIRRACDALLRAQQELHLWSPETYVCCELRKWACSLPSEPSPELSAMLERRLAYVNAVNMFSQKFVAIPHMAELLTSIKCLLSSCREKTKYHELRQILPRIHGETNSISEGMLLVLESILCCSSEKDTPSLTLADSGVQTTLVLGPALRDLDQAFTVRSNEERFPATSIHMDLLCAVQEMQTVNQHELEHYILLSDGLPLTSISRVDPEVIRALRKCLLTIREKMNLVRKKLGHLCARCDAWYNSKSQNATFRQWKANYDDTRQETQDVFAAIDRCSTCINYVDNVLSEHVTSKRFSELSPPGSRKKLKQN